MTTVYVKQGNRVLESHVIGQPDTPKPHLARGTSKGTQPTVWTPIKRRRRKIR